MSQKSVNRLLRHALLNHDININIESFQSILKALESSFYINICHIYFEINYSLTNTRSWRETRYFFSNFVEMAAPEFDQKDEKLIKLNHHDIYFSFGGTFGRKDSSFLARNELLSFLTAVFPCNAAIFQPQSDQIKWLMKKIRENGGRSHTILYNRSIAMAGNKRKLLNKALFVDIQVSTDLLQPGLFASDEENKAYYRLLMIQSWSLSDGKNGHYPDVIAAFYQSEMEEQAELSDRMSMDKMPSSPPSSETAAEESPDFKALQSHFRANPKFF